MNATKHFQFNNQYATTQPGLHGHIDWTMPGREMADGGEKKPQTSLKVAENHKKNKRNKFTKPCKMKC